MPPRRRDRSGLPTFSPVAAKRLRPHARAHEPQVYDGGVSRLCRAAAPVFPGLCAYGGHDHGLPRRDGGRSGTGRGIPGAGRLCSRARVPVFPPSRYEGGRHAEQLSHAVKSARAHAAQRVADDCKQRYLAQQIGQILPVLFETEQDGRWVGHSDNYCLVSVAGEDLRGVVKNVKISAISGQMLVGDLV